MLLAALASIGFASCGGDDDDKASGEGTSPKSQAKELCDLRCEGEALAESMENGDDVEDKLNEVKDKFADKLSAAIEKYGPEGDASDEDKKAFEEAMNNCDCE